MAREAIQMEHSLFAGVHHVLVTQHLLAASAAPRRQYEQSAHKSLQVMSEIESSLLLTSIHLCES